MPIVFTLGNLRRDDHEFETSLAYKTKNDLSELGAYMKGKKERPRS